MTTEALAFQTAPVVTFGYLAQVVFSLLVVLALIVLAAKYLMPRFKINPSGKTIQIVERVFLEPQVSLCLVKVEGKRWLIGLGNKQLFKIDRLDDEKAST
ncbi:hypothetical protein COT42_05530 [Candidatus Saganbacteria bacterium CG08_land_8_20_14_0_20_45_16]|uniref:Flagellar protein n=1 Tax=Candidatus Saganbacteria bacterium CG08_land_8_20_14_0_20_45_16 TaxID=2014293 RepID=A0A2H0XX34_UNCSA|nr:MAG: hypothetical protein COT42_05530 [Candidatus Saganbacteria bacterium CG08_land_8_20_14_0_20_45_16]